MKPRNLNFPFLPVARMGFAFFALGVTGIIGDASGAEAPISYPWSEASDSVRVPKSFLDQITIRSVTVTNFQTMEFAVADEFIKVFAVTPAEVRQLTVAMAEALHQYRIEEGKHLEPTDEGGDFGPLRPGRGPAAPVALEKFSFRVVPFVKEAAGIRRQLEAAISSTLGEERSKHFWKFGSSHLDSEMKLFGNEPAMPPGMTRSTIYTFALKDPKTGGGIDRYQITTTQGPQGGLGRSVGGRPYGEALDQYAPEMMKPILARWRKAIADAGIKGETEVAAGAHERPQAPRTEAPAIHTTPGVVTTNAAKWDDGAPFVDLPKLLVKSLQIPGLTPQADVSPEAALLFGLTEPEQKAVRDLYIEMKAQFEQLERANFVRPEAGKNSFVIRPFPEKSAAMHREWVERLKGLVGPNRAELLDQSIRTPVPPSQRRGFRDRRGAPDIDGPSSGRDWLHRGNAETRIDVTLGAGPDGRPNVQIEYRTEGGERGSFGGPRERIPERWRHLLTPDILGLPLTL